MKNRSGFTLVELLVVAVVGSLVVLVAYQVLITNQRTYTVQNSKVQAQQSARAAMDILFSELREVSSGTGDIVDFQESTLDVRSMTTVGVVCENNTALFGLVPQLLVRKVDDWFAMGDSAFVFADNDEYMTSDDTWIDATVTAVDTTRTCDTGIPAQLLSFGGQAATFVADTVREGAPIRNYVRHAYSMASYDGRTYLGRTEGGGDWMPLVGPLTNIDGAPGVQFEYLDSAGDPTTIADSIARIRVTVRVDTRITDGSGGPMQDSLTASIYLRN